MTPTDPDIRSGRFPVALEAVGAQQLLGDYRLRELVRTGAKLLAHAARQPAAMARESASLAQELAGILAGRGEWRPAAGDKRFAHPKWEESRYYRTLLQGYLAWVASLQSYAARAGLSPQQTGRAKFLLSQLGEALAPTNFLPGNPAALERARATRGRSLLKGSANLLRDAAARRPVPSQVDRRPFAVGVNLAATPGDVVLRTEIFELIQYKPQTGHVWQRPILVVPSIINKYYVFDLAPGRSFFEHLVKSGFTVFAMVFRNPRREHDHWGMPDYVEAIQTALDAVRAIGGVEDPHLMAVCGAGPLAVSLLADHAAQGRPSVGSLTLFVSQLDMACLRATPGLGDFVGPRRRRRAGRPKRSDRISAEEFTLLFAMLRPNDLIWNYWVNNYLLGQDPPAFDILAWNADATAMTAQYNRDFRDFIERNPLVEPGVANDRAAPFTQLASLACDSYVIGARTDHICPWPSVYRSARLLGERCEFVLGGSGHVQTIVSPPDAPKSFYYTNARRPDDAQAWLDGATKVQGSWWEHFVSWCGRRSGELMPAPATAGSELHPPVVPAPGTYVLERDSGHPFGQR